MKPPVKTATAASLPAPELRAKVREALDALPDGRRAPLFMLHDLVNRLLPVPCTLSACEEAMRWNHDRGFIASHRNDELERDEWFITAQGRIKQHQG